MLRDNLHSDHRDRSARWVVVLWIICLSVLFVKCTPLQIQTLKDEAYSASECSFHATLACSAQASLKCGKRTEIGNWEEYGQCLADNAGGCVTSSLAKCAAASIVKVTGSFFAGGGAGCNLDHVQDKVRTCISSREPKTEREAVLTVASCYVDVCEED